MSVLAGLAALAALPALLVSGPCLSGVSPELSLARLSGTALGPTLLVVAGLHGDEPSGPAAVRLLAAAAPPARGSVLLLAEAAPEALAAGTRTAPGQEDLNRSFPGDPQGSGAARRAAAIFQLIRHERPDLILDLHESDSDWTEGDHPALVIPGLAAAAELALAMLEQPGLAGFIYAGGPPQGSLAAEVPLRLGIPVLVVEVPDRLPAGERVERLLDAVAAAAASLGMAE